MDKTPLLTSLGLNQSEGLIYLTLLTRGHLTITQIAKYSKLHRPLIYKSLPELERKQLVTETPRGKRIFYMAESPKKLESLFDELKNSFENNLPELLRTYENQSQKPIIKFLGGKEGIKFVYDDILNTLNRGDVFYRYSSAKNMRKRGSYIPKNYEQRRDAKQIERFVITNKKTAERKRNRLDRDIKIIPTQFDPFEYNITQLIYGDKLAFVDYNTETATIIENHTIVQFQKKLFQLLYSKL